LENAKQAKIYWTKALEILLFSVDEKQRMATPKADR